MSNTLRIDSFEAQVVPISASSRAILHELTVSVLWPHREGDIDLLVRLGMGHVALDEIGRPLGSAMYFPMVDDFATLGMMVTPPRLQAQGAGRGARVAPADPARLRGARPAAERHPFGLSAL